MSLLRASRYELIILLSIAVCGASFAGLYWLRHRQTPEVAHDQLPGRGWGSYAFARQLHSDLFGRENLGRQQPDFRSNLPIAELVDAYGLDSWLGDVATKCHFQYVGIPDDDDPFRPWFRLQFPDGACQVTYNGRITFRERVEDLPPISPPSASP